MTSTSFAPLATVGPPATYRAAEHHAFTSAGQRFFYLAPSGAVSGLTGLAEALFHLLQAESLPRPLLVQRLVARGYAEPEIEASIDELESCDVIDSGLAGAPRAGFPAAAHCAEHDDSVQSALWLLRSLPQDLRRNCREESQVPRAF